MKVLWDSILDIFLKSQEGVDTELYDDFDAFTLPYGIMKNLREWV